MNFRAAACLLGLLVVGPPGALAASFTLGPEQRSDAIRVGARSVTQESFDAEWRVANPSGDSVTVVTPFHRIVMRRPARRVQERAAEGRTSRRSCSRASRTGW